MNRLLRLLVICLMLLCYRSLSAQNIYNEKLYQFLSFEAIPTWTGVATDWNKSEAKLHLYDSEQYKGHAQYISVALKSGITFAQFKEMVRIPSKRKYMPFFLFDLRKKPPMIDGKSYIWALRIEDYAYQDNAQQMTETTLRLLRTVTEYIRTATGKSSNGIVILATNLESQPNVNIAPTLNAAGFPNRTVSQLLALMGGKSVHVLNKGVGYGYLRFVKAGEEATFRATSKDIVVYERMPARVPPVCGIITLEPQTPLSHVNLLAKNRGTFNLYATDTASLPGLHANMGKVVKMECTDQRITIHPAIEAAAEVWWEARPKLEIPNTLVTEKEIVEFANFEAGVLTPSMVGAKAANYARLEVRFPQYVKPGLAIPFYYYVACIKSVHADEKIAALMKDLPQLDGKATDQRLAEIRTLILAGHLDAGFLTRCKDRFQKNYPGKRIRLRSSTNCEDLPGFNGAGLYLSKGLNPDENTARMEAKILEIYASLWTPTAFAEREYYGIDHSKAAMALLVNEAYSAEYANGVVLTIPDKNGYAIAINTQWGDSAVTNPMSGQIPEAILFKSATSDAYAVETKSNLHDIFLQEGFKPLLLELKALTIKVHEEFLASYPKEKDTAYGVDIEFKVVQQGGGYKLYIKQARPLGQVLPE